MTTLYKKIIKNSFFYSSLLMVVSLYGCSIIQSQAERKLKPQSIPNPPTLNLAPSIKMVISGKKSSELNLRFAFLARTKNKDCRFRPITLAPLVDQDVRQYRVIPKGETSFKEEFYLDRYAAGKCQWTPRKIFFSVSNSAKKKFNGKWQSLVMIKNDARDPINNFQIKYKCSENKKQGYRCKTKDKKNQSQMGVIISIDNSNIELILELDK